MFCPFPFTYNDLQLATYHISLPATVRPSEPQNKCFGKLYCNGLHSLQPLYFAQQQRCKIEFFFNHKAGQETGIRRLGQINELSVNADQFVLLNILLQGLELNTTK